MDLDLTPEEIEAAKKRTRRYRKSGQHAARTAKATQAKQRVVRGTLTGSMKTNL